ncbi:MAG: zinc ABC transporter permease AztB [Mycobacterium sp.]
MLGLLTEPFQSDLVRQALIAGLIAAMICAVVGTWVVLRGAAFLGEAMAHGVLPGVALASALGGNIVLGALAAALAMAYGVSALGSSTRLSPDTSIGLLLVGMLALGVIVVSHSRSYATDLTALLFGDVLAATDGDITGLAATLVVVAVVAFVGRRAFVAATFDVRKAQTLDLRPSVAVAALTVLIAVAIVASFQVVGTLLMLGLLVAPPAAALVWAHSIPQIMVGAAAVGALAVVTGLVVSWHVGTAGGATIAITAVGLFFASLLGRALFTRFRALTAVAAAAVTVVGCAGESPPAPEPPTSVVAAEPTPQPGVRELADAPTRLVVVDSSSGATEILDALDETGVTVGKFGPVRGLVGDGRFGYLLGENEFTVVDSGAWTFGHGDHNHYYATSPSVPGVVDADALLDRKSLEDGQIVVIPGVPRGRAAIAHGDVTVVATDDGELRAVGPDGTVSVLPVRCEMAAGAATTRSAVVMSCRDGAVRIAGGSTPEVTSIPFPATEQPVLGALKNRGREGTLVGHDGARVWVLNSTEKTWTAVPVPGVLAANSAGDGQILALTRDGVLRLLDTATATQTAELPLFAAGMDSGIPAPVIEVDTDRAYVNDAAAQAVYEIDYRDGLRLARTLRTSVAPDLMVETGR